VQEAAQCGRPSAGGPVRETLRLTSYQPREACTGQEMKLSCESNSDAICNSLIGLRVQRLIP